MRWLVSVVFALLGVLAVPAAAGPPLRDAVALNIGLSCQWQQRCIKAQDKAMRRALKYVGKSQAPLWRVELCNRNAARGRYRVDWVGFDNCIRNAVLRPLPARVVRKKVRHLGSPRAAFGERG